VCRKYIFKANIYRNPMLQKSSFTFSSLNHLNPICTEVYLPPAATVQNAVISPYRMVPTYRPAFPKRFCSRSPCGSLCLIYLLRIYTVDVRRIYFLNFLKLVLITILKLFYTKIVIFNPFWGFCVRIIFLSCACFICFQSTLT
jgi:hypothetical protein